MHILTQSEYLKNCKDKICRVQAAETEKQYMGAGYQRHEHTYQLKECHKDYSIICPEFRNGKKGAEPVVIVPEYFVNRRPYPVYVYIYAIDLYSKAPEKGQRQVANETRKYFDLKTFAHTTLGRALKAFTVSILGDVEAASDTNAATPEGAERRNFPKVQATQERRRIAVQALRTIPAWADRRQAIDACLRLAVEHFRINHRFLL